MSAPLPVPILALKHDKQKSFVDEFLDKQQPLVVSCISNH
jgi:hypothetical protein